MLVVLSWEIPGGYVEPGEACAREVKEELGLHHEVGRLLVADWAPSESEGDKILFVFDGGQLHDEQLSTLTLPPEELEAARFHEHADLDRLLIPRLARRLQATLIARTAGRTDYLEHGAQRGA